MSEASLQLLGFLNTVAIYMNEYARKKSTPMGQHGYGHAANILQAIDVREKLKNDLKTAYRKLDDAEKSPDIIIKEFYQFYIDSEQDRDPAVVANLLNEALAHATGKKAKIATVEERFGVEPQRPPSPKRDDEPPSDPK